MQNDLFKLVITLREGYTAQHTARGLNSNNTYSDDDLPLSFGGTMAWSQSKTRHRAIRRTTCSIHERNFSFKIALKPVIMQFKSFTTTLLVILFITTSTEVV